ncbi:MAG TPA: hypothetical protein VJL87_03710, partial [Bdellovibrionota bacterium]|nr:hypothetical protein [Bdellovibrionota bacterium]
MKKMKKSQIKKLLVLLLLPLSVMIGCGDDEKPTPGGPGGGQFDNVRPGAFVGNATIRPAESTKITYYEEKFGGGVQPDSSRPPVIPPNLLIFLDGNTGGATASLDGYEYEANTVAVPISNGQVVAGAFSAVFITRESHSWSGALIPNLIFLYKITITGDLTAAGAGLFILNNVNGYVHVMN